MRALRPSALTMLLLCLAPWLAAAAPIPEGWVPTAQRDEIRPEFSYDPQAGPDGSGAFVIAMDSEVGQQGWFRREFPVVGGKHYRFHAERKTTRVEVPRRSAIVRIVWQDDQGRLVKAYPFERELEGRPVASAEPEHPLDGQTTPEGWTTIEAIYRAPENAARAVVELHLQWAPGGKVCWAHPSFAESAAPPSRKVRLATIHYKPSGKSPRENCAEFAPLLAEAARQKADLVVLGETVPSAGVPQKPHDLAEPVPGPSTDYFCDLARQHSLHVVFSLYERAGRSVYNTAVLIDPAGKILGKYRKVCLPHGEVEAGIMPGNDYPVFETALGKVGLMICYDGFFPEVARELTNRGAEIIAWPVWGCDPLLAKARANENRVHIVSSTFMAPQSNWMRSAIYDRDGTPLAAADKWGSVVVAEVDLNQPRIGPYNLGDFHAMVQRHRPPSPAEQCSHPGPQVGAAGLLGGTAAEPAIAAASAPQPDPKADAAKTVAVLVFEGVELMDFAGPAEVFSVADRGQAFRVVTVAESTRPLKTLGGVTLTPEYSYQTAPQADILIVPGGNAQSVSADGRAWIKRASRDAQLTMSVCYGAFLLADAGLLDGIEATTHHWAIDRLRDEYPKCQVVTGKRFVDSGRIITTAGVTAGIDGALHVVERLRGQAAAAWTADEWMEHPRAK